MANGVWHTQYDIEINLTRPDLGADGYPGLLEEIMTSVSERNPQLLECLAHRAGKPCASETGGKSPWMFIRRARVGGRYPLVAAHLPITHKPTPAESDQHKATKERIVQAAVQFGLSADAEVGLPSRRGVTDAMVTGPMRRPDRLGDPVLPTQSQQRPPAIGHRDGARHHAAVGREGRPGGPHRPGALGQGRRHVLEEDRRR